MLEIAKLLNISHNKVRYWLEKNNISRRSRSEASFLVHSQRFNKTPANVKQDFTSTQEKLLISGTMLYWAEGSKDPNGYVSFANSDPKMIQLFLKFLYEICGVQKKRIRLLLHAYEDQKDLKLENYWSRITKVSLNQFHKTYVHKGKKGTYKKKSKHGTLSLRCYDKKL
ncbi:MAG: hypothetical protein KJI70_03285 [Patescibacteria group bacterium]|nr:hypothetical protein [Patescibacteria group bacterium]